MNMYQIVENATGDVKTGPLSYAEALRYMQNNLLNRNEYTIALHMPNR